MSAALRARWLAWALLLLPACKGDTVYLGDEPEADAGDARDAGPDEPDAQPCFEFDDCEDDARPFCNLQSYRCVECLRDWQCESGRCRNESWAGSCEPEP